MNRITVIVLFALVACSTDIVQAQDSTSYIIPSFQTVLPRSDEFRNRGDNLPYSLHTSFGVTYDLITNYIPYDAGVVPAKKRGYIVRKLKQENFIEVDTGDFTMIANPTFNFEAGMDRQDTSSERLYVNTRGFSLHGKIGKNVGFYTRFYENQSFQPSYLDGMVSEYGVIPGQGRVKTFKTTGYDYAMASGVVSFQPNKRLRFDFGTGKNFLGDGYRSLALSRNSFNYPFLKVVSQWGPVQYTNLILGLQNLNVILPTSTVTERRFQRKIGTIHHLDWAISKNLSLGVFEQMIWAASTSEGKLEMNTDVASFLNPIPFVRPLQYGMSDENNVLVGANAKFTWKDRIQMYGQAIIDDPKGGKNGFQIGAKFKVVSDFYLDIEYNQVAPYTYGHEDSTRSFTHYNQPLAHPLGAGFSEYHGEASYFIKNLFIHVISTYSQYDYDGADYHWGKDIFKSDNSKSTELIQPEVSTLMYQSVRIGYQINKKTGMQISGGLINRSVETGNVDDNMQYVFFSFTTNIPSRIYDF